MDGVTKNPSIKLTKQMPKWLKMLANMGRNMVSNVSKSQDTQSTSPAKEVGQDLRENKSSTAEKKHAAENSITKGTPVE